MSSVLHPVGPERSQTYWLRRVGVVVAVLVVLAVIVWAVWPRSAQTAGPGGPDTAAPAATPAPSTSPSTSPSMSPSTKASPGPSRTPSGSARPSSSPSGAASTGASMSPSPSGSGSSAASSSTPTAPAITACDPKKVRVTLTGPGSVKADATTRFKLSVINGSDVTCTVELTPSTFELKIFSGTDRIWSTDDCATWLAAKADHRLGVEKAYEWSVAWTGRRSASGCDLTGGLKAGTYVATAQLGSGSASSTPVQVVMRLR